MRVAIARSDKSWSSDCVLVSCQNESSRMKNTASAYQSNTPPMNRRSGTGVGVKRVMASSMPTRKVMMITRILTSQASQQRSSKVVLRDTRLSSSRATGRSPPPRGLAGQFRDHREQRHVQRNHDSAHGHAQNADDDGLQHGQQVLGSRVHFVLVEVGN